MNDEELHASFYRSERYKDSPTQRFARELAEEDEAPCAGCGRIGWINCRCGTGPTD